MVCRKGSLREKLSENREQVMSYLEERYMMLDSSRLAHAIHVT